MGTQQSRSNHPEISVHELLERSARSALHYQRDDGSFPPGRNYAYDEPETPVRTTAHWLTTLSTVYEITGDERYYQAANRATDFLLQKSNRPDGYTFYCRKTDEKDACNGLVGQAEPIRALSLAGVLLSRQDASSTAEEVYSIHPFNERVGLWERIEIDGRSLSFDRTLNHQILFAGAAVELVPESSEIADDLWRFLDGLRSNLRVHSDGVIKHFIRPAPRRSATLILRNRRYWHLLRNEVLYHVYSHSQKRWLKELSYQPVNLHPLGRLYDTFPDHPLWTMDKIENARSVLKSEANLSRMTELSSGSVLPGIRSACALSYFETDADELVPRIERDLRYYLDENYLLSNGDVNASNLSSTISHLTDFPNKQLFE
ncbi:hypothetical protein [Natrialba aegyptia]|uniref:hypothetical protein n=1 Tax=Natrialba aegyptia TaxID=129789 RepID=UPI00403ABB7E